MSDNMVSIEVAKLTQYVFPHSVIRHGQAGVEDALRGYETLRLYVPEGVEPTTRPINDEERDAFDRLREAADKVDKSKIPDAKEVVSFPYGWMYGRRDAQGVPVPIMFHNGVHIYTEGLDKAQVIPDRSTPKEWAELMLTNVSNNQQVAEVDGEPGQISEKMQSLTLLMALGMLQRRTARGAGYGTSKLDIDREKYGDVEVDERDPEEHGFAKLESLRFISPTARVGMMHRTGDTTNLRTFKADDPGFYVIVSPGTAVEHHRMSEEEVKAFTEGFDSDFKPYEAFVIEAPVGMIDKQEGEGAIGDYQIAVTERIYMAVEQGMLVQTARAWAPKLPFEVMGVTNYLDAKPEVPTVAEVMNALNDVQHQFVVA